jgi:lysophospholipase L1-like esterase
MSAARTVSIHHANCSGVSRADTGNVVHTLTMMNLRRALVLTVCGVMAIGLHAADAPAPLPAAIAKAHRVVFLGDSITYAGTYVDFVEAAIRLRDPAWRGEIIEVGVPSETVSGLSEPGHAGGRFTRPDLHERLDRVLAQLKPDCVIACYGMNDGIYLSFADERFEKFKEGIQWLREKVAAAHATLIHLTPPVYDPKPAQGKHADYNDVLDRYSEWLLAQRSQGWTVIDVHGPMKAELAARRAQNAEFFFAKDGVHPDRLGHAIMARAVLTAWGFPADLAEAPVAWATGTEPEWLKLIAKRRKLLSDAWLTQIGHKRPGMAKGKLMEEAEKEAAEMDAQIRTEMRAEEVTRSK